MVVVLIVMIIIININGLSSIGLSAFSTVWRRAFGSRVFSTWQFVSVVTWGVGRAEL